MRKAPHNFLKDQKKVKYSAATIEKKMNMMPHLEERSEISLKLFVKLGRVAKKGWGVKERTLISLEIRLPRP